MPFSALYLSGFAKRHSTSYRLGRNWRVVRKPDQPLNPCRVLRLVTLGKFTIPPFFHNSDAESDLFSPPFSLICGGLPEV